MKRGTDEVAIGNILIIVAARGVQSPRIVVIIIIGGAQPGPTVTNKTFALLFI